MAAGKFEIFRDDAGEFRWRLRASNGEPVAQSEGYTQKHNAQSGAEAVQEAAEGATIEDLT